MKESPQKPIKIKTPKLTMHENRRDLIKIVIFNVINVILLIAVIFFIRRLPDDAKKVQALRSQEIAAQESSSLGVLVAEIEQNKSSIDQLNSIFITREQFVDFGLALEQLRQEGVLREYNFITRSAQKDSYGHLGLQFSIVLEGTEDQIDSTYRQLIGLPFLVRPISANLEQKQGLETQEYVLRLILYLYVDENFNQN